MIEAAVAFALGAIGFFIGYGKIVERIKSNKVLTDQRLDFLEEQIDGVDKKNEDLSKILNEMNIKLTTVSNDCNYIKINIDKIEKKVENL